MKLRNYFLLAGAFLFTLLIPSFFWIRDYAGKLNGRIDSSVLSDFATFQGFILGFWGLVVNFALLLLAYQAFKNFDVKKQFHNKQLDLVAELATAISTTMLSVKLCKRIPTEKGEVIEVPAEYKLSFFDSSPEGGYSEYERMYVLSNNIENIFPFLSYRKHPMLPKSIATSLDKFYRPLQVSISVQKDQLPGKYVILSSPSIPIDDYSRTWIYEFNEDPTQFSKDAKALRQAIQQWFKEYGADELNI